jgi:hypothetical protein
MKKTMLIIFILSIGLSCLAQKKLFIRPALGLHTPFSKVETNGYKPFVTLINNSIWLTLNYEIGLEYKFDPRWTLLISYGNGRSGVSMGVLHTEPCIPGGSPPNPRGSDLYHAEAFNDRRLLFQTRYILSSSDKKKAGEFSIQAGLGIDFKSNENDSSVVYFIGTNQCGEDFSLEPFILSHRKKMGLVLPLQINFDWSGLMLSVFYHQGITTHFIKEIDYVTNNYTDKSFFKVRGTSMGFKLSYPIRVLKKKIK